MYVLYLHVCTHKTADTCLLSSDIPNPCFVMLPLVPGICAILYVIAMYVTTCDLHVLQVIGTYTYVGIVNTLHNGDGTCNTFVKRIELSTPTHYCIMNAVIYCITKKQ